MNQAFVSVFPMASVAGFADITRVPKRLRFGSAFFFFFSFFEQFYLLLGCYALRSLF